MITDHPKFSPKKREPSLWTQTEVWDKKVFAWLISPDRKKQIKVDITDGGKVLDGAGLIKRLKETLAGAK